MTLNFTFDASVSDLELDSRSPGFANEEPSVPVISLRQLVLLEFGLQLRLVSQTNLIYILSH